MIILNIFVDWLYLKNNMFTFLKKTLKYKNE